MMKLKYLYIVLMMAVAIQVVGQTATEIYVPKVGEPVRDFEFTNVDNYPSSSFKISDFRGKWLIIDFWAYGCVGCIASFPKMNELHHQFKDRVQLVMVGVYSTPKYRKLTEDLYADRKSRYNLSFTNALDSLAAEAFNIHSVPVILVIDPEGIIRAKTTVITEADITAFLSGNTPDLKTAFNDVENLERKSKHNRNLPLLTNGIDANGGKADTAFLFRSLLTKYTRDMPLVHPSYNPAYNQTGRLEFSGLSLASLYRYAYIGFLSWTSRDSLYGKYAYPIVLEISDSTDFKHDERTDKGHFTYSLIVPDKQSSKDYLRKVMRADLDKIFNYDVSIEKRLGPAYRLTTTDPRKIAKIKTKVKKTEFFINSSKYTAFKANNVPLKELIVMLRMCLPFSRDQNSGGIAVLIDNTGIDYNVDIDLEADFLDIESVNKALNKIGLTIEATEIEMETIVIRDRKI